MVNKKQFVFLESNTTGTGELLVHQALAKNLSPIFIAINPKKYSFLPVENVELAILDTSNKNILLHYLSQREHLAGIYSSSEYYIETASWLAEKLQLPGTNSQTVQICRDKYSLHQLLISQDINSPKTTSISDINNIEKHLKTFTFPIVIKPTTGSGSTGVKLCNNKEECLNHLDSLFQYHSNVLIQEYIDGHEFSVEVCSMENEHYIIGVTKKYLGLPPYFIETGHDFPAILSDQDKQQIEHVVIKLLTLLNFNFGFSHIELRINNGNVWIIEVNPRLAGGMIPVLIKNATDLDLLNILLELYTKHDINFQAAYNKFSSIRHLIPNKSGRIKHINFINPGFDCQEKLIKNKGELFTHHGDFRDRIAYVLVTDPDAKYCQEKADCALKSFYLEIETES